MIVPFAVLKEMFPNISENDLKDAYQDNLLDLDETVAELQNTPGMVKNMTRYVCLNLIKSIEL